MKKFLVLSGFLDQRFAGNLKEVGQIAPDSARILSATLFTKGDIIWCT